MKLRNSATGTLRTTAVIPIGRPLSASGSGELSNIETEAGWLATCEPGEADGFLRSLALRSGVGLEVRFKYVSVALGENGGSLREVERADGCDIRGSAEAQAAVLAKVERFLTPAPRRAIEAWLCELSVLTARRKSDEAEAKLTLDAYARRLAAFPADIVREALLETRWHFWPTWAELETRCATLFSPRRAMIWALGTGKRDAEHRAVNAFSRARREAEMEDQSRERERKRKADEAANEAEKAEFERWRQENPYADARDFVPF